MKVVLLQSKVIKLKLQFDFDAVTDAASFCRLLCTVHGAGWLVFWNQNADIDMDQRGRAY